MNHQPEIDPNSEILDYVLRSEDELLPTSGFCLSVMQAVEEEVSTPAPIKFPWMWALPGIVAMIAAFIMVIRYAGNSLKTSASESSFPSSWLGQIWLTLQHLQAGPVFLTLASAYICLVLARRIAGAENRSLLF